MGFRTYSLAFVAVLATAFAASCLTAAGGVAVSGGTLVGYFDAGFSPSKLSTTEPRPIRLRVAANFVANRGTGPFPAMEELIFRTDKQIGIDVRKTPTAGEIPGCGSGRQPPRTVAALRKACAAAVIGGGRMEVQVQLPDQPPVSIDSELTALNGGVKGGKRRVYIHAFLTAPAPGWIVTTAEIRKIRDDTYGMEAAASIPKIAGGYGSITSFAFSLKQGILTATCPNGRLDFDVQAAFADGTQMAQPVVRTCTGKEQSAS
jgi:hypothetical protein